MSKVTFNVVDPTGVWFLSKASFPLVDPNTMTRFNAGQATQAAKTAWTDMQVEAKIFVVTQDPTKVPPAAPPTEAKLKAKATA